MMIVVNEMERLRATNELYLSHGIVAINSVEKNADKCTWICHNDTSFCKANHVTYLKSYFKFTDPVYFGAITLLQKTGNYGLANIIILVILVPLLLWFFLVKSFNIQDEISTLKKRK
jgi:hypothetical protein